jgi:hypothetical protein
MKEHAPMNRTAAAEEGFFSSESVYGFQQPTKSSGAFLRSKAFLPRYVTFLGTITVLMLLLPAYYMITFEKSFNFENYISSAEWMNSPLLMSSTTPLQHNDSPDFLIHHRKVLYKSTFDLINADDKFASIRKAYQELNSFHNEGGSLTAITQYLTDNIDSTFKIHGMTFKPTKQSSPSTENTAAAPSISTAVKEALVANDQMMRGGYDQRQLPGAIVPNNNKQLLHKGRTIEVLEPWDGTRWEVGLGPISPKVCKSLDVIRSKSKGSSYDDKFMCSYTSLVVNTTTGTQIKKANDNSATTTMQQCNMISIGSNGQWGFEENIIMNTNCVTHTFDCTVTNPRKPSSDSINFYPLCISGKNEMIGDRQYVTYSKMIESAGLTKPPVLFKIDVEGFEFNVFTNMLEDAAQSNTMDMLPTQISVELHYATRMYDVPWMLRSFTTSEIAMFVGMMYRRGGYVLVHYEPIGPGCWPCAEVLFVRTFCDDHEEST